MIIYQNTPCIILECFDSREFSVYFKNKIICLYKHDEGYGEKITSSISIRYYLNENFHRKEGPSIIFHDGEKHWHKNGKRHCLDGPAIEYADGHKEYWINGIKYWEEKDYICQIKKMKKDGTYRL